MLNFSRHGVWPEWFSPKCGNLMTTLGAQHQAGGKDKKVSSFLPVRNIFFVCLKSVWKKNDIFKTQRFFLFIPWNGTVWGHALVALSWQGNVSNAVKNWAKVDPAPLLKNHTSQVSHLSKHYKDKAFHFWDSSRILKSKVPLPYPL